MAGAQSLVRCLLLIMNSLMGALGFLLIVSAYGMAKSLEKPTPVFSDDPALRFLFTVTGKGTAMVLICCFGYLVAESSSSFCLYTYLASIFMLIVIELKQGPNVFLGDIWIKGSRNDLTRNLEVIRDFYEDNYELCELIRLLTMLVPVASVTLALLFKALEPSYIFTRNYYIYGRTPVLHITRIRNRNRFC